MVFSSIIFLFYFLPISVVLYYAVPKKYKNYCLLITSLIFYAYGEIRYLPLIFISAILDYSNGKLIYKHKDNEKLKKLFLIISICINLSLLGFFKYSDFLIENINFIFNLNIDYLNLALPLGISFYTFQTMTYSIDIYQGKIKPQNKFSNFLLYVTMFPQLIAGPIVKYEMIEKQINNNDYKKENIYEGFIIFLNGLFMKVLLANNIGLIAQTILDSYLTDASKLTIILYMFSYAMQLYFDFNGYSIMAKGLGKMFGYDYPINFNYPYISKTISEFWSRWHITLSSFFKEYVYIPLGGNKKGKFKTIRNLAVVWLLTGLWHGASYNFIIFGVFFGVFIIMEKLFLLKLLEKIPTLFKRMYVFIVVLIGFTIFSIVDLNILEEIFKNLFKNPIINNDFIYLFKTNFILLIIGFVCLFPTIFEKFRKLPSNILILCYIGLFNLCLIYLVADSYNPFIYFRF